MATQGWKWLRGEDKDAIFDCIWDPDRDCGGPYHLEIDPVDSCNADCYFCNSAEVRRGDVLGWDRVRALLDDARPRGLRSVRLSGGGESLLYPHFVEIIDWLERHGVRLDNMTTNGVTLAGRRAEALARVPPAFLMVSLNYATPERYEWGMRIPRRSFHKICENLEAYHERLAGAGRRDECQIQLQFMISRETIEDLPEMFALAKRLNATAVTLRGLYDQPPERRLTPEERRALMNALAPLAMEYTDEFWIMLDLGMEGLEQETAELSNAIHARHRNAEDNGGAGDSEPAAAEIQGNGAHDLDRFAYCLMPWYSMTVVGTGRVYPCCILLTNREIDPLGNLNRQTLAEVWNGEAFKRYRGEIRRAMVLDGPAPMSGRLCRHTTAMCWKAGGCHIASKLGDPGDVARLARQITDARSSLPGRLTRMRFGLIRKGIDTARAVGLRD